MASDVDHCRCRRIDDINNAADAADFSAYHRQGDLSGARPAARTAERLNT